VTAWRDVLDQPLAPSRLASLAAFVMLVIIAATIFVFALAQPGHRPQTTSPTAQTAPRPPPPPPSSVTPGARHPSAQAPSTATEGTLPRTRSTLGAAHGARHAAIAFVNSYRAYQERRIPVSAIQDADPSIEAGLRRMPRVPFAHGPAAVRLAEVAPGNYAADSSVGHFTLVRRGRRWLVTALPGD